MSVIPAPRLLFLALLAVIPLALGSITSIALVVAALFFVALAALVVFDIHAGPRHDDFTVERHHDQRLSLGEPNVVTLAVRWTGSKLGGASSRALWLRD